MNSEEWIRKAVDLINDRVFCGELGIETHKFQISWGRRRGKKPVECIQPSDAEDISLDDFFPTTFVVDFLEKDKVRMLAGVAMACIEGFFNIKKGKAYKKLAAKYGFEAPYKDCLPTPALHDVLKDIYKELGEFPNTAVMFPKKETKPSKKTHMFCPNCGYEVSVKPSIIKKYGLKPLTCICGTQMGIDYGEEEIQGEGE